MFDALQSAVWPGILVATLLGIVDALRALRSNTYVHFSRYFWPYVSVPVLATALLALVPATAAAMAGWLLALSPRVIGTGSAALCALAWAGIEARAWRRDLRTALAAARVPSPAQRRAAVVANLATAAFVAGTTALAPWLVDAIPARWLPGLGTAALLLNLALIPGALSFVLRDFRFRRPTPRAPGRGCTSNGAARRPSVLLLSIDTLRADRLTAYGGGRALTPHLDALARRGTVCETAIATSSWTLPSVASFLTGLYPSQHGAGPSVNGFDLLARAPLRAGTWTLAEGLRAAGYATHAVVSNPYLALSYGLGAGFDTYENVTIESEAVVALRPTLAGRLFGPLLGDVLSDSGRRVTARGLHRLQRLLAPTGAEQKPFFLWLHYIDPHAPYGCTAHKSFRGDTLLSGLRAESELGDCFEAIARLRAGEIRLSAEERDHLVALYDAGVAEVDRQIGRVLEALRHSGREDEVLVVAVSDHGEEFWEHGGVEHGHTFYEELVRVPFLVAGPGVPADARLDALVSLADLPPAVLDLLGLPVPAGLDGHPLPFGSPAHAARVVRCESLLFAEEKVGLRTERYKYVRSAHGKEELYDLRSDPRELSDLAVAERLDWARQLLDGGEVAQIEPPRPVVDTAAIQAAMERLGYA